MSSKTPFPNPLDEATLAAFCHPCIHALSRPALVGSEVIAANGYIALRAHRGRWLDSDFDAPSPEHHARIQRLNWDAFDSLDPGKWDKLDDVRGQIYRTATISFWATNAENVPTGRPSATPIWKVGKAAPVRLSLLQLIARLPRCEVYTGPQTPTQPLYFRCTGARGIIAVDPRLEIHSWHLFAHATYDAMADRVVDRPRTNTLRETINNSMRAAGCKPLVVEDLSESVTIIRED